MTVGGHYVSPCDILHTAQAKALVLSGITIDMLLSSFQCMVSNVSLASGYKQKLWKMHMCSKR